MPQKPSEAFHTFLWHFFPSLKQNFIAYRSSKVSSRPDCIFEIRQQWQPGFSRVYSNCYCSFSFEAEIIKIRQSSHKMYSNNILNSQESTTILNACAKKKKSGNIECTTYIYIYIYIYKKNLKGHIHTYTEKNTYKWNPKWLLYTHTLSHTQRIKYQK